MDFEIKTEGGETIVKDYMIYKHMSHVVHVSFFDGNKRPKTRPYCTKGNRKRRSRGNMLLDEMFEHDS